MIISNMHLYKITYCIILCSLFCCLQLHAQKGPHPESIYDERDFLGFTTSSPPPIDIATPAEYQNGKFSDAPSSILLALGLAWTVSIRSQTANLTSGSNNIPVSNVTVQVVGVSGIGTGVVTLSTTSQVIASGVLALTANFSFRYTMKGGNHLLVPAGTYTSSIIFTTTGL